MAVENYLQKHFADIFNKIKIHDLFCVLSNIEIINFDGRICKLIYRVLNKVMLTEGIFVIFSKTFDLLKFG